MMLHHDSIRGFRRIFAATFGVVLLWGLSGTTLRGEVAFKVGAQFTGSTYGSDSPYVPPDCNGMASLNHYVELINGRFSVYDKTNGTRLLTLSDSAFWNNAGLPLGSAEVTDPRVIYDPSVNRWFASTIDLDRATTASNRFLIAISTSGDPTAGWKGVAFAADPDQGNFADFPTLGLDKNGVYIAGYMFRPDGTDLGGNTLVSIPKADLLGSEPSAAARKSFGFLSGDSYGNILQPIINLDFDDGDGKVLAAGSLGLDFAPHSNLIWTTIHDAGVPGSTDLGTPLSVTVPEYSVPINPAQPGGYDGLDDGDARLSANVYQIGGFVYGVQSCEVAARAAIRWYRMNPATGSLVESGTVTHPELNLIFPSLAANSSGVMVIGCNGCSSNSYLSCYAYVGQTVNGITTINGPILLKAGTVVYNYLPSGANISRWGDYSSTCVDPSDPFRFWTIQMYPSSQSAWATYIAEIRTAIPHLTISEANEPGQMLLSWNGASGVLGLESTEELSTPVWGPVSQPPTGSQGKLKVLVPAAGGSAFFRLSSGVSSQSR
jgi:hypothetical protein